MRIFRNQGKQSLGIGFITGTIQFFVGGFLGQKTDKQSLFVNMTGIIIHVTTDVGERERERENRYS